MGNPPSGWLPPPYPTPLAFSQWCTVDENSPGVNYLGLYGLQCTYNNAFGLANQMRWYGRTANVAALTPVYGIGFDAVDLLFLQYSAVSGAGTDVTLTMNLYAVLTNFDPATLTWAGVAGLTHQLVASEAVGANGPGAGVFGAWTKVGLLSAIGTVVPSTCYGFALELLTFDSPGPPAQNSFIQEAVYVPPAARASIANWRVFTG